MKTAVAIRHVHFEDLGTFEAVLQAADYQVHYYDVGVHELWTLDPVRPELLLVLGGPVGVYETDTYPSLAEEISLLERRMQANRPTFGICLGAQLMAAALRASVRPGSSKEIGFSPLTLTRAGAESPLRHLAHVPVMHWHGDTFDIPPDTAHLAATDIFPNQAFARGANIMAVQFHPEADLGARFERWLVGHAAELSAAGIDPRRLREAASDIGPQLCTAGRAMFAEWLEQLES